jgi:O-antigen ligase
LIYYPGVIVGALLAFWLGNVVARNPETLRRFYMILTAFAVSIAIHAIIQRELHVTLLGSPSQEAYVSQANNYLLEVGNGIARVGSFFINPDFAGMFFATVVFVPLALYASTTSLLGRVCYLTAAVVMLPALLFTFSASSALAIGVGAVVFLLLLGDMRARLKLLAALGVGSAVLAIGFASQIQLLIEHGTQPKEAAERQALWQGAVRAIEANPLTGVGLGHRAYLLRADAIYHLPAELRPFDHPHNSYLELGAMAGLPVLGVFLALLACALWLALRNWKSADPRTRVLLAAGIAGTIALSFNSWLNEGWTLPPLAALGWMNLGMIGSPLLRNALGHTGAQREHEAPEASP